ncbi:hypothetical protein EVAR_103798_1 [Eumeta japonica]|uniref:Uncharacterized protein n=1 Tax=Eumeta variegata TaxID=151549 RepID=A0A4C1Z583_EUMVA|nr:hypothetical protein EVAR_103798_1 [Eumeta japonica]
MVTALNRGQDNKCISLHRQKINAGEAATSQTKPAACVDTTNNALIRTASRGVKRTRDTGHTRSCKHRGLLFIRSYRLSCLQVS